jgi:hypothetical protein
MRIIKKESGSTLNRALLSAMALMYLLMASSCSVNAETVGNTSTPVLTSSPKPTSTPAPFNVKNGYSDELNDEEVMEVAIDIYNQIMATELTFDITADEIADASRSFEAGAVSDPVSSLGQAVGNLCDIVSLSIKYGKTFGLHRILENTGNGFDFLEEAEGLAQALFDSRTDAAKRKIAVQNFVNAYGTKFHDRKDITGVVPVDSLDKAGESLAAILYYSTLSSELSLEEQETTYLCVNGKLISFEEMQIEFDSANCAEVNGQLANILTSKAVEAQINIETAHRLYRGK